MFVELKIENVTIRKDYEYRIDSRFEKYVLRWW